MIRILLTIVRFLSSALVTILPRKKNIWLFSSWMGRKSNDNPKAVYDYMKQDKQIRCIWICKCYQELERLTNNDSEAYYYKSLRGIYYQSIAGTIFFTHGVISEFNSAFIGFTTRRVNLWHGMPIKKIGFDDVNYVNRTPFESKRWYLILRNEVHDYYVSVGEVCTDILASAFLVDKRKILEFGFPRNDKLQSNYDYGEHIAESRTKVLYMPTFKKNQSGNYDIDIDAEFLIKKSSELNIEFYIKPHPMSTIDKTTLDSISDCESVFILKTDDIYDDLPFFDVLISDISSVIFDFALLERTILLFSPSFDEYLSTNRAVYEYSKIISRYMITDWNDLFDTIKSKDNTKNFSIEALNFHANRADKFSATKKLCSYLTKSHYV